MAIRRKKKLGKKVIIVLTALGLWIIRFILEQFGEKFFGAIYSEYIEPILNRRLYIITKSKELLSNAGVLDDIEKYGMSVNLITLIATALIFLPLLACAVNMILKRSNVSRNKHEENIIQAMKALVDDFEYIQAAQIYRYSIARDKNKCKKIAIDHIASQYNPGFDINTILHEEFSFEERYYKAVSSFLYKYNIYENSKKKTDLEKAQTAIRHTLEALKNEFSSLSIENINERHCCHFAIYKGIQCTLREEEWEGPTPGCSNEITDALRNSKRTGCLPTILLQSVYTFRNGQSAFKKNRIYWSFVANEENLPSGYKKLLVVLTLSYEQIQALEEQLIYSELVRIVNGYLKDYVGGNNSGTDNE